MVVNFPDTIIAQNAWQLSKNVFGGLTFFMRQYIIIGV